MTSVDITFLSSRKRGISPDLRLVKRYLHENVDQINFRYFVNSELSPNYMVKRGIKQQKESFLQSSSHIICVDASLPGVRALEGREGKRVLLAIPFDYQFKNFCLWEEKSEKTLLKTFQGFTHILAPTPFTAQVMKNIYQLDGIQLMEGANAPYAWYINQPEIQSEAKKQIVRYYNGIENKKILSILTAGEIDKEKQESLCEFDLKKFLDSLGRDWFVFTNSKYILEQASALQSSYSDSVGFVDHVLPDRELLCISDVLVTNNSTYAGYFASRMKPVFCLEYSGKYFEKYMEIQYPALHLNSLEELLGKVDGQGELSRTHQEFQDQFSYKQSNNPSEVIRELVVL